MNNSTGAATNATTSQPAFGAVTIAYNAAVDSYTISNGTISKTFTPANGNGSDSAFVYYIQTSGSTTDQLSLFKSGATNSRLALTYVTYGFWTTSVAGSTTTDFSGYVATGGVQTTAASMPTSGSATFTGIADGAGAIGGQAYRLSGSTGSLTANFGTGALTTSVDLKGNPNVSSDVLGTTALGTLTGSGTISSGTNKYTGTISGISMTGTINGAFFGPAAIETGYSFSAAGGGNTVSGVFVGKH